MAETIQVSLNGKVLSLRDAFREHPINTSLVLCTALFDVFAEYFDCFILLLLFASSLQRQRKQVPHSLTTVLQCCRHIQDGTPGSNDLPLGDDEQIERFFYRKGRARALAALGAFAEDWKAWDVIFRNLGPDHLSYLVKAILEIIPSDDFKIIQYKAKKPSSKPSTKSYTTAKFPGLYWRGDRSSTTTKPKEKQTGSKRRRTDERVIEFPRESHSEAGPGDPSGLGQPTTLCISSAQGIVSSPILPPLS
ncbi:hypothetical protein CDV31_016349 [Fusarium ambrosium]|uniref:Uncharacterized protein n=1 Tax=Fusarium ambrosium TaxID=131363 RepID=A0A428SAQ2_9HYPO|nr:hypothetical protein CDV31_016349 [Fusarium ambrosium]